MYNNSIYDKFFINPKSNENTHFFKENIILIYPQIIWKIIDTKDMQEEMQVNN
jgi:hypothetical protein